MRRTPQGERQNSTTAVTPRLTRTRPDPEESARAAGLRYTTDTVPGIQRIRHGSSFRYIGPDKKVVRNSARSSAHQVAGDPAGVDRRLDFARSRAATCRRPAATRAAASSIGITQVARGPRRDQVRPHDRRSRRRCPPSAAAPRPTCAARAAAGEGPRRGRQAAREDLHPRRQRRVRARQPLVRPDDHAGRPREGLRLDASSFVFRGKSGVEHELELDDRRLARDRQGSAATCRARSSSSIATSAATSSTIGSADVNAYLKEITGEDFTSKDFRTWAGTVLAAKLLRDYERGRSDAQAKKNIVQAIEQVAKRLGNTRAVCRKCYVHPAVIDAYLDGSMMKTGAQRAARSGAGGRADDGVGEAAVLGLLQRRARSEARRRAIDVSGRPA